jgi:hypothetical protein
MSGSFRGQGEERNMSGFIQIIEFSTAKIDALVEEQMTEMEGKMLARKRSRRVTATTPAAT